MAVFSNTLAVIRQYVSGNVGDLILGTADSGSSTTLVDTMLRKGTNWYRDGEFRCYIYDGVCEGEEREVSASTTNTLSLAPAYSTAITSASKYELHSIFTADDYLKAINLAIESGGKHYLIDLKDETTIRLTSTTDNLGNTLYTYEYALPTSMMYIHRIITEHGVSGYKLTGTITGTFVNGEKVTGQTSGATGIFRYQATGYIRVREVDGTFAVGEDADGAGGATCDGLTAVDSETCGDGTFRNGDTIDPRNWSIIPSYPPKLKLDRNYYTVVEDLRLRLEGQMIQDVVDDDDDIIALPPDWLTYKAITFLPTSKIESNKLQDIVNYARAMSLIDPVSRPYANSRKVME